MERIQIERISEKNKISDRSGGSGGHRVTSGASETFSTVSRVRHDDRVPIPIAVICDFHGMKWGFGTSAGVVILVTMIGGPEIGLTTAFYAGALGMAMGYGFLHKLSYGKTLCLTILAYILEMSYKIIFSIYVLGIADALTGAIDRFTTFLRWIWIPLSSVFGFDPDPGKAMFTKSGMVMLGIVFILNAYCYAYLNMEIGGNVLKRLKGGIRG